MPLYGQVLRITLLESAGAQAGLLWSGCTEQWSFRAGHQPGAQAGQRPELGRQRADHRQHRR